MTNTLWPQKQEQFSKVSYIEGKKAVLFAKTTKSNKISTAN